MVEPRTGDGDPVLWRQNREVDGALHPHHRRDRRAGLHRSLNVPCGARRLGLPRPAAARRRVSPAPGRPGPRNSQLSGAPA